MVSNGTTPTDGGATRRTVLKGATAAVGAALADRWVAAALFGAAFLIELTALEGRSKLAGTDVRSFITY